VWPLWKLALHVHPSPSTLSITTGLQSSENKDVSIGPGLHPVHSPFHLLAQCRRQNIQTRGAKS